MGIRTVNEGFAELLTRMVPTQAQRDAGASHRKTVNDALGADLNVLRTFETGSFTHGTGVRGYSDIDLFASLGGSKRTPDTALRWVRDAMKSRFPRTPVEVRRPSVAVRFGDGYETWEITPAFLESTSGSHHVYDIPGWGGLWIRTAPEAHIEYVRECNEKATKGKAKALARLVKAWKYYNDVPISSFYLEMHSAQHVASQTTYIHVWDLCQLLESLVRIDLAAMNDPSGLAGRIYPCGTDAHSRTATSKLVDSCHEAA